MLQPVATPRGTGARSQVEEEEKDGERITRGGESEQMISGNAGIHRHHPGDKSGNDPERECSSRGQIQPVQ